MILSIFVSYSFFHDSTKSEAYLVESLGQEFRTTTMRDIPITRMIPKEFLLSPHLFIHWFLCINILLTPSHYTNESQLQRVNSSSEDIERVRSCIHQVEFRQDSDCTSTLRIYSSG